MTRYIALLRGINVGGRTIKSAELSDVFRSLGYDGVRTVLASGNVVFESDGETAALRADIEKALGDAFGYDARVHVIATDALAAVVDAYPFPEREGWHRYVVFVIGAEPATTRSRTELSGERDAVVRELAELKLDPALESLAAAGPVVYWTVERGHTLDSVVGKRLGTSRNKALTTNRNVNTLQKLLR